MFVIKLIFMLSSDLNLLHEFTNTSILVVSNLHDIYIYTLNGNIFGLGEGEALYLDSP